MGSGGTGTATEAATGILLAQRGFESNAATAAATALGDGHGLSMG